MSLRHRLCAAVFALALAFALTPTGAASAATLSRDGWSLQLPRGSQAGFTAVDANPLYNEQERQEFAVSGTHLKPNFYNLPAHLRVDLAPGQEDRDAFFAAALYLIPVQPYLSILSPVENQQDTWTRTEYRALQRWLDGPPDAVRDWPFLPFLDMSPQYTVQRRALAFAGGRGIRVLTQFVPDVGFAQSGQLSYVFQGLTTDGQYYVLLTMPLALSGLAGRDDDTHLGFTLTQLDTDRAADARYEAAIDALLRKRGKELQPDLARLDALVRSLRWEAKAAAPAAQP
ncbi:hypothetical protein [Tahibacter harae]|uniref:Uncharacterized protein n=1 Tax=Tahibacter harae TaxID=2963937 RepID=A0ABT1QZC0_9GAMM|nr:hypothetical protein [Tahibacter harae]MCQ4167635.1 hypothetical protein [Tahibacter harae]